MPEPTPSAAKPAMQPSLLSRLKAVGPALIVAAVVLGPGSILTASKVGCQFGYGLLWVLASAVLLMIASTALASYLGVSLDGTVCDELTRRGGRGFALFVGITLFLVVVGFQSSNNIAVLAGLEPLLGTEGAAEDDLRAKLVSVVILVGVNLIVVGFLALGRHLYKNVERVMKACIVMMVLAFLANLVVARPSITGILGGLVPSAPDVGTDGVLPRIEDGKLVDPYGAVLGMIATTFSIAGAFYQAYLVRERKWTTADVRTGLVDSFVGICTLGLASAMVMITSAAALHARGVDPATLTSTADVAAQLEVFGDWATVVFSVGIFAGAFSSFLVNAMIGGTLLADGLGKGSSIDEPGPKWGTVAALVAGMAIAITVTLFGKSKINAIIIAQALTVLGGPVLSGVLLWLAIRTPEARVPKWILVLSALGFLVVCVLAIRTAMRVGLALVLPAG